MALKYQIAYRDVANQEHVLEIYDNTYSEKILKPNGRVFLEHSDTDDPLEAIRGKGLRVELDADDTTTFEDLYNEEQRTFPVIYKRNSVVLFNGWINSEGWFEDYVNDKWKVSFDCVDGLGFLEDLAFVYDDTGLNYVGTFTQIELLSYALLRTGLQQNINVDIQIYYTGLSATSILENVNARATRYIKDDDNTVMSCEEVIRDILEPYGACLTSHNGEWYIYKPNQIFDGSTLTYYSYDYEATPLNGGATSTLDIASSIGSDLDSFSLFHCNANQSISKANSIGAFRVNYKYGRANSLVGNYYFHTADGLLYQDWTIAPTAVSSGLLELPAIGGNGAIIEARTTTTNTQLLETKVEGLSIDDVVKYRFTLNCTFPVGAETGGVAWNMDWKYQIISSNNAESVFYYLRPGGKVWGTTAGTVYDITPNFTGGIVQFEQELDPMPQDGKIIIRLFDGQSNVAPATFDIQLSEFDVMPSVVDESKEGEFHTVQRTDKPARKSEDVKEVFTGDTASDLYVGTLYKADASTPTTQWYRTGVSEEKPILQIYGEEVVRLSQQPPTIFSGDVYGYFPYLSRVTINNITGVFMPTKWRYDTMMNTISCEFRQVFGDEIDDILYELTYDYGNVVKPTIRGKYTIPDFGGVADTTAPVKGNINSIFEL
jgi:hypothetical protein